MISHPAMRRAADDPGPWGLYARALLQEFDEQALTIVEQAREIDRLRADLAEGARLRALDMPTPGPSARWAS